MKKRALLITGIVVALLGVTTALAAFVPPIHQAITQAVPPLANVLPGSDRIFRINGPSMNPTLQQGQIIRVDTYPSGSTPQRGDIVVFTPPGQPTQLEIKRVIGLPGETIVVTAANVTVNGMPLSEPYVAPGGNGDFGVGSVTLSPNHYFVLGDNRQNSADSREFGPIPLSSIIGKMVGSV